MKKKKSNGDRLINKIGSMNESNLHDALKNLYADGEDKTESTVGGFIADIVKNGSIIEIQTVNFFNIKKKLTSLLAQHKIKIVYPIALEKTLIVYDPMKKDVLYKRKSPKKGNVIDIVNEIIHIPELLVHPNFSLEVVLTREEEIRAADGEGSWRRKGISIIDRRLLEIKKRIEFNHFTDYLRLLPNDLPPSFTNRVVSQIMRQPIEKVQKLTYSLRQMGLLHVIGKQGNAQVYQFVTRQSSS